MRRTPTEDDDVLCALLAVEARWGGPPHGVDDLGIDFALQVRMFSALKAFQHAPWSQSTYLRAIATEEARLRMERARDSVVRVALEVVAVNSAFGLIRALPTIEALRAVCNELREARLQAFSPTEAVGLVRVTP